VVLTIAARSLFSKAVSLDYFSWSLASVVSMIIAAGCIFSEVNSRDFISSVGIILCLRACCNFLLSTAAVFCFKSSKLGPVAL